MIPSRWRHRGAPSATNPGANGAGQLTGVGIAILTTLGAALPAGLLYCAGRATRNAILITWGLDPELLPLGRIETIYVGLGAGLSAFLTAVATLILLSLYVVPVYGLNRLIATKLQQRRDRKGIVAKKRSAATLPEWLERSVTRVLMFGLASAFSVAAFLGLQVYAERNGADVAHAQRQAMTSCDPVQLPMPEYKPVRITRVIGSATEHYAGFSITCASTGCAVFDPVHQVAQFVPRDGVARFDTTTVDQVCHPASANPAPTDSAPATSH